MAFVAVPGNLFNVSRSRMARRPSGVAAFAKPSMLAAMFINMEPMAGCSAGTSGKSQRMGARRARASCCTSPLRSARRITPSQSAMMPTSGRAIFITAVSAIWNAPLVTSASRPVAPPMSTANMTSPSQM